MQGNHFSFPTLIAQTLARLEIGCLRAPRRTNVQFGRRAFRACNAHSAMLNALLLGMTESADTGQFRLAKIFASCLRARNRRPAEIEDRGVSEPQ